jgi:hypothetical protein
MDQDSGVRMLRDRAELQRIVSLVLDRIGPEASGLGYRLVGTGAALAQGVQLPVGDVDILVARRADVDRVAAALAGFRCLDSPAWLPEARQYYAQFEVEEIGVGFSTVERLVETDAFECIGPGPWKHCVRVRFGQHVVPVVGLELRLGSELVRDRPDRYLPLIEHMRLHGADLQLVQKAMSERGVDPVRQKRILDQLQPQ